MALTDRQKNTQTNATENNTTLTAQVEIRKQRLSWFTVLPTLYQISHKVLCLHSLEKLYHTNAITILHINMEIISYKTTKHAIKLVLCESNLIVTSVFDSFGTSTIIQNF